MEQDQRDQYGHPEQVGPGTPAGDRSTGGGSGGLPGGLSGGMSGAGSPAAVRMGPRMSLAERLGPAPADPVLRPRSLPAPVRPARHEPVAADPEASTPIPPMVAGVAAAPTGTAAAPTGTAAAPTGTAAAPVGPAAPVGAAAPAGSVLPTLDSATLLRRQPTKPSSGWRRVVAAVSLGTVRPGPGAAEVRRRALVASIRTPITGTHRVAVVSLKGGVGKTTTTIMLGSTLASLRGDRVVAVDGNPDAGTLGDRLARQTTATLRDLLTDHDEIASWSDLARYTSQARSRLEVIANDVDPAVSTAVTAQDYLQVVELLGRYYSVILTDSGTGLLHDAMSGILGCADTLVVVSSAGVDGARSAATTLDWLTAQGHGHLVEGAVTVISAVRPGGRGVDIAAMSRYFASRCRAVVEIPFDAHLEVGAETDLDALAPATRAAYLELAGQVAQDFARAADTRPGRVPAHAGHRTAPTAGFLPG